jgi:hypothetical protein
MCVKYMKKNILKCTVAAEVKALAAAILITSLVFLEY